MKQKIKQIRDKVFSRLYQQQNALLHLQAKQLMQNWQGGGQNVHTIRDAEFKVYSQWGEDGIIQWLIRQIPIENETFIEFGVEDYKEANTRFLLEENNWSGMIIDGSKENMDAVTREDIYWRYDLQVVAAFITKENINELLKQSGFDEDLGILSIDIDGNDYWVLQEINVVKPRILICEYNPIYGVDRAVTIPYASDFYRTKAHYSNLYYGCSLKALVGLTKRKGYSFIGTNSNACNAFFIRDDLTHFLPDSVFHDNGFIPYKSRQARDEKGDLLFLNPNKEKELIADMILWDIEQEKGVKFRELF